MLVHTVFFWLKKGAPAGAREQLVKDCLTYLKTPTVKHLWAGPPSTTTPIRDVVDATYDVGLTVVFDDAPGHDAYQEAPSHQQFIERNKAHWQRVVVYDVQ